METKQLFILILLIIIVVIYLTRIFETFVNGGIPTNDDITAIITTDMNYDNSVVSKMPIYPNNLLNGSDGKKQLQLQLQMQKLRTFKPGVDGPDEKPQLYKNELTDSKEEFTQMNPIYMNN